MALSIFEEKTHVPEPLEVKHILGDSYEWWREIRDYVYLRYPEAKEKWSFPGKKYGWSYSLKDRKRAIIYFIPAAGYFKIGMVYGKPGIEDALSSDISEQIKGLILSAKSYAEGTGFRVDIKDSSLVDDIKTLINIKLAH